MSWKIIFILLFCEHVSVKSVTQKDAILNGETQFICYPDSKMKMISLDWYILPDSTSSYVTYYNDSGECKLFGTSNFYNFESRCDSVSGPYHFTIIKTNSSYNNRVVRCVVRYDLLQNNVTEWVINLIFGPSSMALQKKDNKLFGIEGHSLQITCTAVGGNPAPDVQIWMYGSMVNNGKQEATYTKPILLRSDDGQTVTCRAGYTQINSLPLTDSADIYLNLKPLSTSIGQGSVSVVEYKHLVISCTSVGSRPAVVFHWDIGGTNITDSSVITSRTLDHPSNTYTVISTLKFNVTKDNNGQQLTCTAINIAVPDGVSAGPTNVAVKCAPDPPKNLMVIDQTYLSIKVQWEAGFDGGYEQTFYIVYKPHDSGKWETQAVPTSGINSNQLYETNIEGLHHSTKYEIKMFAENKIDKSAESLTLTGFTNIKSNAEYVTYLENKAKILTGVTAGLSVITVISVVIIAVLVNRLLTYKRKTKRTTNITISKDSMPTPQFYDNVTDTEENNLEIDCRNYDTLGTKDKPNAYEALGLPTKELNTDSDGRNYETLGTKDQPKVYEELGQSTKDRQSMLYSNTAI